MWKVLGSQTLEVEVPDSDRFDPDRFQISIRRGWKTQGCNLGMNCHCFRIPGFRIPDFRIPGFRTPDFHIPGFRIPDFRIPGFRIPDFRIPGFRTPGYCRNLWVNSRHRYWGLAPRWRVPFGLIQKSGTQPGSFRRVWGG